MKNLFFILCITFFVVSCNRDEDASLLPEPVEEKFDINNPVGYGIYFKTASTDGTWPRIMLFEFQPGKILKFYDYQGNTSYDYTLIDDNTIDVAGLKIVIIDGKIVDHTFVNLLEAALIKLPETNQLAGKTFTGTYYNSDNSVLHNNFFYTFSSDANKKVDAGFTPGTPIRTENYTLIGNIAAQVEVVGSDDLEFMIWVNGKLEVNYFQPQPFARHYGTFNPQ